VFKASQDGTTTFMVPFDDPEDDRCIFTSTLLEGLWGEALAAHPGDAVTGGSLAVFVKDKLPGLSRRYSDEERIPSVNAGIPSEKGVYFRKPPGFTPPSFPPWPPKATIKDMGLGRPTPTASARPEALGMGLDEGFGMTGPAVRPAVRPIRPEPPDSQPALEALMRTAPSSDRGSLGVSGATVTRIRGLAGLTVAPLPTSGWWQFGDPPVGGWSTPLLVDLDDGNVAAAVAAHRFATLLAVGEQWGVAGMVLQSAYADPARGAVEAVAAMEQGASIAPAQAIALATEARHEKHTDPVLGVISAYLYDAIGDTDSIRRMAWSYVQHDQPIPYDIALLGLLHGWTDGPELKVGIQAVAARDPRTPDEEKNPWTHCATGQAQGTVAGRWPWMRQGWAFLEDPTDEESTLIHPALLEVGRKHLAPGRFATVTAEGARILADAFVLEALWSAREAPGVPQAGF
jgi:hypothetical protein